MLISDSLLTWVWSSVSIITHGSSVFAGVQTSFCDYEDVWLEVIKRVDEFIALPIATDGKHINSIDFKEWGDLVLIYVANLIICRYWRVGGLRGRSIVGWTRRHCRSPKICEFHLFGTRLYLLFQIYLVWCRPILWSTWPLLTLQFFGRIEYECLSKLVGITSDVDLSAIGYNSIAGVGGGRFRGDWASVLGLVNWKGLGDPDGSPPNMCAS